MCRDLLSIVDRLQTSVQLQDSTDFISRMPDDVLVMILSLLSIKDAAVTSILSARWRFLWCNVSRMEFNSHKKIYGSEIDYYINQVNNVIQRHNRPVVQDFRIRFNLNSLNKGVIDEWLQFAANKKVEFLELNFVLSSCRLGGDGVPNSYDFPLRLFEKTLSRSKSIVVELVSLKKLILKEVNVTDAIFHEFLTNSPYLEMISIHHSRDLNHVRVGGRALNLKHFEIVDYYFSLKSIYLCDFGLESFSYRGSDIDLRLAHLPKLKEIAFNVIEMHVELNNNNNNNNVFLQISSCASSLQSLHICQLIQHGQKKSLSLDSFPKLPNVTKLRINCGREDNLLQHVLSIANVCPNLNNFAIQDLEIQLCLARRPKRKELDVCHGLVGLNNNVFGQIPSCLSFLQHLSINICDSCDFMECLSLDCFPELPFVTNLRLTSSGRKRDCLMDLAFILNACPNLKTCTIKPLWTLPIMSRREARSATNPCERLMLVVILGYYGRMCDFELAAYITQSAVALKRIVIDTRYQAGMESETARTFSRNKEAARSSVKGRLKPILPRGAELVIH